SRAEVSTGTILPAGDTDGFTLSVDPGQTITVVVRPTAAGGLQPTVALFDGSDLVATATAPAPGGEAVLQAVRASGTLGSLDAPRTYPGVLSGAGGTAGPYALQFIRNAAVEDEGHGGQPNDTRASAQDLEPTFLVLSAPGEGGPPPARGAVLGQLASAPGDQDFYSFTLRAGESATLALK